MAGANWLRPEPVQGWGRFRLDSAVGLRVLDRKYAWDTFASAIAPLVEPPTADVSSPLVTKIKEDTSTEEKTSVDVLPDWNPDDPRFALPVGRDPVTGRIVALDTDDTIAMALLMRSGAGKTWSIAYQLLSVVHSGWGATVIVPDLQSVSMMSRYLAEHGHADRTTLVDFAAPVQLAWNPLGMMPGAPQTECRNVAQSVVSALCAAGNWGASAARIRRYLQLSVQTLTQLNAGLPGTCQATLYQICELVRDEHWRSEILTALPAHVQLAWTGQRQTQLETAMEPVTGLLDSLRLSAGPTALLGMSETRWSVARDIAAQRIGLIRMDPNSQEDQTLGALVASDVITALYTRAAALDSRLLTPHYAVIDEAQAAGRVFGPAIEFLAQQGRKARIILTVATQDPRSLPRQLERALMTNATWIALNLGDAQDEDSYRQRLGAPAGAALAGLERQIFCQLKRQKEGIAHMCLDTLHLEDQWGPIPDTPLPVPDETVTADAAWAHQKQLPEMIVSALGSSQSSATPAPPVVPDDLGGFGWEIDGSNDDFGGLD